MSCYCCSVNMALAGGMKHSSVMSDVYCWVMISPRRAHATCFVDLVLLLEFQYAKNSCI